MVKINSRWRYKDRSKGDLNADVFVKDANDDFVSFFIVSNFKPLLVNDLAMGIFLKTFVHIEDNIWT